MRSVRVVLVAHFILLMGMNVYGQSQPPLDTLFTPLAWETVDAKGCSARFRMPRGHTVERREIDAHGRKLDNYSYVWSGSNGQIAVSCGVHPFFVDDVGTLRDLYDADLTEPFRIPSTENLVSTDITLNGHPARQLEFTRADGKVYLKVWVMLIGDIRFQVSFGTFKEQASPKPQPRAVNSSNAFFDSISFTNSAPAISKSYQESLPEGYLGFVDGRKYINKPFRFSLELPTTWSEQSTARLQKFVESNVPPLAIAPDVKRSRILLHSSKGLPGLPAFPAVMIVLEKQRFLDVAPKSIAELNRKNAIRDYSVKVMGEIGEEMIDGKTFSTSATQKRTGDVLVNQISYHTSVGAYTLTFNLHYVDESQLSDVLTVMRSIRFTRTAG